MSRRAVFPTPRPWYLKSGRSDDGAPVVYLFAANGHILGEIMQTEDARAIVAAVNARGTAKLVPVRIEVAALRHGKPIFLWVNGFKVITPSGAEIQPYMRSREAREFCRSHGWAIEVKS